jgi:hypothetical protein
MFRILIMNSWKKNYFHFTAKFMSGEKRKELNMNNAHFSKHMDINFFLLLAVLCYSILLK